MSALTDLFTAMANKIRSKTGEATTYTPSEMASDGIDDVFDAGVASATTPITPSDSSPASMTANTGYKPTTNGYAIASYSSLTPSDDSPVTIVSGEIYKALDSGYAVEAVNTVHPSATPVFVPYTDVVKMSGDGGYVVDYDPTPTSVTPSNSTPASLTADSIIKPSANGYAIESYDSVTPSSTPTSVSSGDIVQIGGSGVIVDSIPTPTSLTPSNSNPATITSGATYTATTGGKAIASYSEVAPSNANPPDMYSGSIYKIKTRNGLLISTASLVSPSDSNPPQLVVNDTYYRINGASGYLYASNGLKKVKTGSVSLTANTNNTITTGFQPKYICWNVGTGSLCAYNEDISTTQFKKGGSSGISNVNIGTTASYNLISISSTGFVIRGASSSVTMDYFAIG